MLRVLLSMMFAVVWITSYGSYKYVRVSSGSTIDENNEYLFYDDASGMAMGNSMTSSDISPIAMRSRLVGVKVTPNAYGTIYELGEDVGRFQFERGTNTGKWVCLNFASNDGVNEGKKYLTWASSKLTISATASSYAVGISDDGKLRMTPGIANDSVLLRYFNYTSSGTTYHYWHLAKNNESTSAKSIPDTYLYERKEIGVPEMPRVITDDYEIVSGSNYELGKREKFKLYVEDAEAIYLNGERVSNGNEYEFFPYSGSYEVYGTNENGMSEVMKFTISNPRYEFRPVKETASINPASEYILSSVPVDESSLSGRYTLGYAESKPLALSGGTSDEDDWLSLSDGRKALLKFVASGEKWKILLSNDGEALGMQQTTSSNVAFGATPDEFSVVIEDGIVKISKTSATKYLKYANDVKSCFYFSTVTPNDTYWPVRLYERVQVERSPDVKRLEYSNDMIAFEYDGDSHVILKSGNYLLIEDKAESTPVMLDLTPSHASILSNVRGDIVSPIVFTLYPENKGVKRGKLLHVGDLKGFEGIPEIEKAEVLSVEHYGKMIQLKGTLTIINDSIGRLVSTERPEVYYTLKNIFIQDPISGPVLNLRYDESDEQDSWVYGEKWPAAGEYAGKSVAGIVMPSDGSSTPELWATAMTSGGTITGVEEYENEPMENYTIYTLNGVSIQNKDILAPGIYIILTPGKSVRKYVVK